MFINNDLEMRGERDFLVHNIDVLCKTTDSNEAYTMYARGKSRLADIYHYKERELKEVLK